MLNSRNQAVAPVPMAKDQMVSTLEKCQTFDLGFYVRGHFRKKCIQKIGKTLKEVTGEKATTISINVCINFWINSMVNKELGRNVLKLNLLYNFTLRKCFRT